MALDGPSRRQGRNGAAANSLWETGRRPACLTGSRHTSAAHLASSPRTRCGRAPDPGPNGITFMEVEVPFLK